MVVLIVSWSYFLSIPRFFVLDLGILIIVSSFACFPSVDAQLLWVSTGISQSFVLLRSTPSLALLCSGLYLVYWPLTFPHQPVPLSFSSSSLCQLLVDSIMTDVSANEGVPRAGVVVSVVVSLASISLLSIFLSTCFITRFPPSPPPPPLFSCFLVRGPALRSASRTRAVADRDSAAMVYHYIRSIL